MEKINLWESKQNKNYIFFKDLESYFKYLEENNLDLYFTTKETYNPQDTVENYLDNAALQGNLEITYTDNLHPIALGIKGFTPSFINPTFFKEHIQEFKDYSLKKFQEELKNKKSFITIPEFIFSDELIDKIINDESAKEAYITCREFDKGLNITEEQINKIKKNHLEFTINKRFEPNKKISTKKVIDTYTIKVLKSATSISLTLPITEEEIDNFIYINDNTIIKINASGKKDELNFFNQIKYILNKLSTMNKSFNITFNVENRELLRQSNLLNNIPNNINIQIENDLYKYDIDTFNKDDDKLEQLAKPIRESNLSPFEKYLAVYNIVKNFKPYKENEEDKDQSRALRYILDDNNEFIVCVGYSKLLKELLNRVNIPCKNIHVSVDLKRDKDYNEELNKDLEGHARNIVNIDDDKYNIHGYYVADSTWDNDKEIDFYLNSLMTFDRKKEARRLETLESQDLLLDFHNFEEFQKKIDFYLKRNIKKSFYDDKDKKIKSTYRQLYYNIMEYLHELDYSKYLMFFNKYDQYFNNSSIELSECEKKASEMLTEYAEYIIPLSNNKVSIATILKAATNVKKELDGYSNEQIKEWLKKVQEENKKYEKAVFPYKYDSSNGTEAFLEAIEDKKEEQKHTR